MILKSQWQNATLFSINYGSIIFKTCHDNTCLMTANVFIYMMFKLLRHDLQVLDR